jgi:hypothetical protein
MDDPLGVVPHEGFIGNDRDIRIPEDEFLHFRIANGLQHSGGSDTLGQDDNILSCRGGAEVIRCAARGKQGDGEARGPKKRNHARVSADR